MTGFFFVLCWFRVDSSSFLFGYRSYAFLKQRINHRTKIHLTLIFILSLFPPMIVSALESRRRKKWSSVDRRALCGEVCWSPDFSPKTFLKDEDCGDAWLQVQVEALSKRVVIGQLAVQALPIELSCAIFADRWNLTRKEERLKDEEKNKSRFLEFQECAQSGALCVQFWRKM